MADKKTKQVSHDFDSSEYIAQTKKMIEAWYNSNKVLIYRQVQRMQVAKDATGNIPEKFTQNIPLPQTAQSTYSSARLEISFSGDAGGNPTYLVKFFVTEKNNNDIDSGSKTLTLRKKP